MKSVIKKTVGKDGLPAVKDGLPAVHVPDGVRELLHAALLSACSREQALTEAEVQRDSTASTLLRAAKAAGSVDAFRAAWAGFRVWYRSKDGAEFLASHGVKPELNKSGVPLIPGTLRTQYSVLNNALDLAEYEKQAHLPSPIAVSDIRSVPHAVKLLAAHRENRIRMEAARSKASAGETAAALKAQALRTSLAESMDTIRNAYAHVPAPSQEKLVAALKRVADEGRAMQQAIADELRKTAEKATAAAAKLSPPIADASTSTAVAA